MVGERKHGVGGESSKYSYIECDVNFQNFATSACHKKTHETKIYKCQKCPFASARKYNLQRHDKSVHNREKIKCEHCESSFGRKDDLARHKRRKHTLQKCEECEFSTCEKCGLEYHMLEKHEGEALVELTYQKKHKCIYCNHNSDSVGNVRRHNEKKTPQKVVMEKHTVVGEAALNNSIVSESNELMRKLELEREVKRIVLELNAPTTCLRKEFVEALELFEKHEQVKNVKPVVWRPW